MQPQVVASCDRRDPGDRIGGCRCRRADRGDDRDRPAAGGEVLRDGPVERVDPHPVLVVRRDVHERVPAEAEDHARLFDRAVRFRRRVDARLADLRPARQPALRGVEPSGLACRGKPDQRSDRGRVREQPVELVGQPERLAQPGHDHGLELGPDRRRSPQERVLGERGHEQLAHDTRGRARGREVGHETGVVPRRRVRLDEAPIVLEDRRERLGILGRTHREERRDRARLDRRQDRTVWEALCIVGHEVGDLVEHLSECGGIEVGQTVDLCGVEARLRTHPRSLAWRHGSATNEGGGSGCV